MQEVNNPDQIPKINCSFNSKLLCSLSAEKLEEFYHELAYEISKEAEIKLYLNDDVFSKNIIYSCFDRGKIKDFLRAAIKFDCGIIILLINNECLYRSSNNLELADIDFYNVKTVRIYKRFYDENNYLVHGARFSLLIDFWQKSDNIFHANHFSFLGAHLAIDKFEDSFTDVWINGRLVPAFKQFATVREYLKADDPIDVVYTWVDSSDPKWRAKKDAALRNSQATEFHPNGLDDSRFLNNDELMYSLRSVSSYLRGIRHIYIVTDNQKPEFLNTDHPKIKIVDHKEIFSKSGMLPSFNSNAIGSQLHHIAGLADKYLYFNDDIFVGRSLTRETFFDEYHRAKCFYSNFVAIPPSEKSENYTVVDCAAINNREILHQEFGHIVFRKFQHAPIATLRKTMCELEGRLTHVFQKTSSHQFRSREDNSIAGALYSHFASLSGKAVPGEIRYTYIDTGELKAARKLQKLVLKAERDRPDIFCVNATERSDFSAANIEIFKHIMSKLFSQKCEFER